MKFKIVEDAEKDYQARAEALKVWTAVSKVPESKWDFKGSILVLPLVIIDKKYDDLDLMLRYKKESLGASAAFGNYRDNKDKNVIILYCLGRISKKKVFSSEVITQSFVHEFTHYLDKKGIRLGGTRTLLN